MNCLDVPFATLGLVGVIAMDTSVAELTVRVVDPEMLPDAAVIVVEPVATEAANPFEPAALLIVATPVLAELQVAAAVRSCVVLSEKVPVAVNCLAVPLAILGLVGVIAIDTSVAGVIVIVAVLAMLSSEALIIAEPTFSPVTRPALLTCVVALSDELQFTDEVRSVVVLFE